MSREDRMVAFEPFRETGGDRRVVREARWASDVSGFLSWPGLGSAVRVRANNLSRGGARLQSSETPTVGELCRLYLGPSPWWRGLALHARVVAVRRGAVHLSFVGITADEAAALTRSATQ
ncbi:MAG: PilZ domain-containing protein [Candidatus Eremiobacterota bacterium]